MGAFDEILKFAIAYVTENGFDNAQRINELLVRLRKAAEQNYRPDSVMIEGLKKSLEAKFKKATSKSHLLKYHPGVSIFTINSIMPQLRTELDRRIMVNADMIRLNREQAIDKTLQRFSGWATSIPAGGSRAVNKAEVKADISKSARQLRYETNRREIDQGHKLISAIDSIVGMQTNAIAMEWKSQWKRPGYDYRKDHKERDGKVYAIRGSWAMERGLINKGAGYTDEITAPAEEVYCSCKGIYLSGLRELPDEMLTKKGRDALEQLRKT